MSGKKVLVVDDEVYVIELLESTLKASGYEVIVALDGREALTKAVAESPDIISLDINMPGMNGFAVCQELKARPETKRIPIIMLSALVREADAARGLALGAALYIKKPWQMDKYVAAIKRVLGESPISQPG